MIFAKGETQQFKLDYRTIHKSSTRDVLVTGDEFIITVRDKVTHKVILQKSVKYPTSIVTIESYETANIEASTYDYEVKYVPVDGSSRVVILNDLIIQ